MTDAKSVLETIDQVLGVIQTIANTPGVNMIPYVSTVAGAISLIRAGGQAGINILPYLEALKNTFGGGVPTQSDLDALEDKLAALKAELNAPFPPADPDEPE